MDMNDDEVPRNAGYEARYWRQLELRVAAVERDLAVISQELASLKGGHEAFRTDFSKHIDASVTEAVRASARQEVVIDAVNGLKGDIREIRAQSGKVSISAIAQVAAILSVLGAAIAFIVKVSSNGFGIPV